VKREGCAERQFATNIGKVDVLSSYFGIQSQNFGVKQRISSHLKAMMCSRITVSKVALLIDLLKERVCSPCNPSFIQDGDVHVEQSRT